MRLIIFENHCYKCNLFIRAHFMTSSLVIFKISTLGTRTYSFTDTSLKLYIDMRHIKGLHVKLTVIDPLVICPPG